VTPEWNEWKGAVDVKIENTAERFNELEQRMRALEDKVGDIVAKLAVPLFLAGIGGPILGAIIVYMLTKGIK
jgi:hypothetical protein